MTWKSHYKMKCNGRYKYANPHIACWFLMLLPKPKLYKGTIQTRTKSCQCHAFMILLHLYEHPVTFCSDRFFSFILSHEPLMYKSKEKCNKGSHDKISNKIFSCLMRLIVYHSNAESPTLLNFFFWLQILM